MRGGPEGTFACSMKGTCEGYLTLCCVDYQNYLAVADLNTESLNEAWNNAYARELRRKNHALKTGFGIGS